MSPNMLVLAIQLVIAAFAGSYLFVQHEAFDSLLSLDRHNRVTCILNRPVWVVHDPALISRHNAEVSFQLLRF